MERFGEFYLLLHHIAASVLLLLLRQTLGEVMEIPQERIKKSRAALFNHLIQKYAQNHKDYRD